MTAGEELERALDAPAEVRWGLGRHCWAWAGVGVLLAGAAGAQGQWSVVLAFNAALTVAVVWDAARLGQTALRVSRRLPGRLGKGEAHEVAVEVDNRSGRRLRVRIRDDVPLDCAVEPQEHSLRLSGHERRQVSHVLTPLERGPQRFGDVHLELQSALGLGAARLRYPAACEVRVVPASTLPRRRAFAGPRQQLGEVRLKRTRRQQGRGELEMLREFVAGDELRDVDWKATARRNRPITRVYQQERSQFVWLILDASRAMATQLSDAADPEPAAVEHSPQAEDAARAERPTRTKLDAGLDAALTLARHALAAGDQVGAVAFADGALCLVPPGRGQPQYRRLLDALYAVRARPTHLDLRGLVTLLEHHAKRRALLVLFTDLEEESHVAPLWEHAPILRRRHLPVCVSLDDMQAGLLADAPSGQPEDAYIRAAAADVLHDRDQLKARLHKRGLSVVEATQSGLPGAALAKYLEVKANQWL